MHRSIVRNNYDVAELWEKDLDYVRWVATELREQRALQNGSIDAVRKAVKPIRYEGWPLLPPSIVPPGQIRAVPLTSQYLLSLDKEDLDKFKRIYGYRAVVERIAEGLATATGAKQ